MQQSSLLIITISSLASTYVSAANAVVPLGYVTTQNFADSNCSTVVQATSLATGVCFLDVGGKNSHLFGATFSGVDVSVSQYLFIDSVKCQGTPVVSPVETYSGSCSQNSYSTFTQDLPEFQIPGLELRGYTHGCGTGLTPVGRRYWFASGYCQQNVLSSDPNYELVEYGTCSPDGTINLDYSQNCGYLISSNTSAALPNCGPYPNFNEDSSISALTGSCTTYPSPTAEPSPVHRPLANPRPKDRRHAELFACLLLLVLCLPFPFLVTIFYNSVLKPQSPEDDGNNQELVNVEEGGAEGDEEGNHDAHFGKRQSIFQAENPTALSD